MRTKLLLLLATLSISLPAHADKVARSLPYDKGASGVLQRLRLKGKKVVVKDQLADGGARVRTDVYTPRGGGLQKYMTTVEGTHADGVAFKNTHIYNPVERQADVLTTLGHMDDVLGGSIVQPSKWKILSGAMGLIKTTLLRSESTIQKTTYADGRSETSIKMGLKDGTVEVTKDNETIVKSERGTMHMPAPGLRRIKSTR